MSPQVKDILKIAAVAAATVYIVYHVPFLKGAIVGA